MTVFRCAALGGLVLLAADAGAQSLEDARSAYAEGRFLEAAEIAEALETSGRLRPGGRVARDTRPLLHFRGWG